MRARYNKNAVSEIEEFDRYIKDKEALQSVLLNKGNKEIYVEIGMGKGDFIFQMAKNNPEGIYIGVELCLPVLALAIKKINRNEEEQNIHIDNLYVMSFDAINIADIFSNITLDKIYLNFSDPWPKKKHSKRRLTSSSFLEEYKKILKKDGIIEFKTDNRLLFEYSLVSMQNFGFTFLEVYLDLHKTDIPNIRTEYEEKFSKLGPIYKIVVRV